MTDTYKPSWRPDNNDDKFACRVMRGVEGGHVGGGGGGGGGGGAGGGGGGN